MSDRGKGQYANANFSKFPNDFFALQAGNARHRKKDGVDFMPFNECSQVSIAIYSHIIEMLPPEFLVVIDITTQKHSRFMPEGLGKLSACRSCDINENPAPLSLKSLPIQKIKQYVTGEKTKYDKKHTENHWLQYRDCAWNPQEFD